MLYVYVGDDQLKKVKITLVQADLDEIKQEQERNNSHRAANLLVSSIRLLNHTPVRVIKLNAISCGGFRYQTPVDISINFYTLHALSSLRFELNIFCTLHSQVYVLSSKWQFCTLYSQVYVTHDIVHHYFSTAHQH